MAGRFKNLQVGFYVVEPRPDPDGSPAAFATGEFPSGEVLDEVAALDIASGRYYLETNLLRDQVVCFVHGRDDARVLGAYSKDSATVLITEHKGELGTLDLRDDEGIVDPTFVAFFPNSVAGVLRATIASPGVATIADYISDYTHCRCVFRPLPSTRGAIQARLANPDSRMHKLVVGFKRAVGVQLEDRQNPVAQVLYAAAKATTSKAVRVEFTAPGTDWSEWWREMDPAVRDLLDVVSDLDVAKIEVTGGGAAINLKRDFVSTRVAVATDDGRVTPHEGANALYGAYDEMREAVDAAVSSWREVTR